MEGIGSEVSHKIRAAIKAKLIELGAYVDDELPDYIMVMVANKRTRAQMDEDLQLFLSSNTKIFTSWLHTVLQKLQEVTVATFESKKDSDSKKSTKLKKSETEDSRSRKSSEETIEKVKKHGKKHKEAKKSKKNKHKSKEKGKSKKSDKEESKEKSEKEDEKKTSQDKNSKGKKVELNEAVGRAILGDLKKNKKLLCDKPSSASSSTTDDELPNVKSAKENGGNKAGNDDVLEITVDKPLGGDVDSSRKNKVIEDEFNIEPLKPSEKVTEMEETNEANKCKDTEINIQVEKTISAPTEELLKQHDKIQNEKLEGESKMNEQTKPKSDSEESLSPEEIRKQLLLSRAKKKLEESKKAERMRSNSPDVLILEETAGSGGRQKDLFSASSRQQEARSPRSTHSGVKESSKTGSPRRSRLQSSLHSERSHSPETYRKGVPEHKSKTEVKSLNEERKKISLGKTDKEEEKKKNVIKISESLQMEKNMGVKKDVEKSKETTRKRPVSSRVVTITGPEAPEIPSIVKVKPREFISKDKQANKALILKAVADAEKSIATVQARPEIEAEPKKEALYTKTLREKRYEKLAITLSNIRRSPDRLERRVSIDSEKSDKKRDSSDLSDGVRMKSDISKKISKSEDQFISSKTTVMEKNDKYIRCWLEGVEKAVKDDEMVNPSEMDDLTHSNLTDDENAVEKEDERKRKRKSTDPSADISPKALKLTDKEIANLRVLPNSGVKEEGPQIVVTLDGLDSKAIKDLILKNKETAGRPLLSSGATKNKNSAVSIEKPPSSDARKLGFEKISDRFGRLNRTKEDEPGRGEKKPSKHLETDKKKDKVTNESKNRQLIAQLSEKFGKVDREFENRKRKRPDDDRRYSHESRRTEKEDSERNGRYRKSERRSFREGTLASFSSSQLCKFYPNCKNTDCRYFHPKKCKFDEDCINPDCKYVHTVKKKSKWYSKS